MSHGKRVGILGDAGKARDEGVGIAIGNLQRHTQQHGEDEEDGHLLLLEQGEGTQAEGINHRARLLALVQACF